MIVAPSVLSLDYCDTKSQMELLEQSKADWIHFDVMDGHFVPNLSFGPDILKAFKKKTTKYLDVHIMVDNPFETADMFIKAGANSIVFHSETVHEISNQIKLIDKIKEAGIDAGISIKPDTCIENILPILNKVDIILVMSVYPGFGGQSFMPIALDKIKALRKIIDDNHYHALIEVDGGINDQTAKECVEAGVDVLVAGSYAFKGDLLKNVEGLWKLKR